MHLICLQINEWNANNHWRWRQRQRQQQQTKAKMANSNVPDRPNVQTTIEIVFRFHYLSKQINSNDGFSLLFNYFIPTNQNGSHWADAVALTLPILNVVQLVFTWRLNGDAQSEVRFLLFCCKLAVFFFSFFFPSFSLASPYFMYYAARHSLFVLYKLQICKNKWN